MPTAALIAILLFVTDDSQQGKADARLAAGLQTAVAVFHQRTADAATDARRLGRESSLAAALRSGERAQMQAVVDQATTQPGVVRVELLDNADRVLAASGSPDAVAFAGIGLTDMARPVGKLRLSTTTAGQYVNAVRALTDRQLVLRRGDTTLASTVPAPSQLLKPDQTADLSAGGNDYRAHAIALDSSDAETLMMLGPPKSGGLLGIGAPALAILVWFLIAAVILAWVLARTLTRLHRRVSEQALTDPLTGLWNRRYFAETLDLEVSRSVRFGHPISLIILDVDDFKEINDREGHLQGDAVLEKVTDVVSDVTRTIDVAARFGGDELALILIETGREGAAILGERLGDEMRATRIPMRDGRSMRVTVSVGAATIPDSAHDVESLVDAADRALLRAKRAGKNQIRAAPATHRRDGDGERPGRHGGDRRSPA